MPTLFVTKETGGKTLPSLMTVTAPATQVASAALEALGNKTKLNGVFLADLLSSFAQLERDAVHLYRCVAEKTQHDDWHDRYEEFGRQSEDHIRVYEELIRKIGGDPQYVSPGARMVEFRNTKLMESVLLAGSVDEAVIELTCLEAVIIAESQCHSNWHFMSKLAEQVKASDIRSAIQDAVKEVEPQEDEHIEWARSTREKALLEYLSGR